MEQHSPRVTIILACRNEREHIASCLSSILGQEAVPGGFEVIVADGNSNDGTRQILENLAMTEPCLRIVDNGPGIVSTGLNAALRVSRGEIIVRMDAHTEYARDYVRRSVEVLDETAADNVGGPARTMGTGAIQGSICAAFHSPFSVGGARFHDVSYEGYVDTVPYGCWRRSVFDRIGFFDEELVRNQDDEFNLRLVRHGGRIWQSSKIKSWYKPRASLKELFLQYTQYGYWKIRVIQKHRIPASIRHLIPGAFVLAIFGLPILSLLGVSTATWAWIAILLAYVACLFIASAIAVAQNQAASFPVMPLIFATYHFAYGLGFLRGILDFVIFQRKPTATYLKLSRSVGK